MLFLAQLCYSLHVKILLLRLEQIQLVMLARFIPGPVKWEKRIVLLRPGTPEVLCLQVEARAPVDILGVREVLVKKGKGEPGACLDSHSLYQKGVRNIMINLVEFQTSHPFPTCHILLPVQRGEKNS